MGIGRPTDKSSGAADIRVEGDAAFVSGAGKAEVRGPCRANSQRGLTDPERRSYPPVEAVCRGLGVLRAVNKIRIASIADIHRETGIPKPSIVRLLETLMAEGYVVRDNMCGGYRVTHQTYELYSGYEGISQVIEISRPLAIDLTRRIKWPIGIGLVEDHAIAIKFWTGTISPVVHRSTALGLRPDLLRSAMGRAYLGFCSDEERERHFQWFRADPNRQFGAAEERRLLMLLKRWRVDGYAFRDPEPRYNPYGTTTLAAPIREGDTVHALVSVSFFTNAVSGKRIAEEIVTPLKATTKKIEEALLFVNSGGLVGEGAPTNLLPDF